MKNFLLLSCALLAGAASSAFAAEIPPPVDEAAVMRTAPFVVDAGYLARHDIVYKSPMQLEAEGFPLGNGDMGGLVWTRDDGVEFQINKNDVWSNPEPGSHARVQRHCARVRIDFGLPVFGWTHVLNDFEGRLSLAKGEASFAAKTGFAKTVVRSWLAQDRNVWVVECDSAADAKFVEGGASAATVSLERLGSRAFGGWYAGGYVKDPASGLGSTRTTLANGDMILEETGDGMNFVVACRILGADGARRVNNHRAESFTKNGKFTVLVAVVTKEDAADPRAAALALLDRSAKDGVAAMRAEKDARLARFWSKSFVKLGDDYLENLWYMRRYLAGAGSRGKYPLVFNGGLWRWNRDVVNWITPHHWNTQQQYWGLCAENDCDLMLPYLNTYYRMMQRPDGMARLAAKRGAKNDAILLAEMHNFDGSMVDEDRGDMRNAYTQAAQVASRLYEYCEFTGDKKFLAEKALPFMRKAANFYLQKLAWDAKSGRYSFKGSNYEDGGGFGPVLNPASDRNAIEALFKSCVAGATTLGTDADLIPKWRHVLGHLWERRLVKEQGFEGEVLATCDTPGKFRVTQWALGGAPVFPAGVLGVDDRDTPVGKAVMNYIRGTKEMYSHHPTPVIAARMGMGDDALRLVRDGASVMQYFPSGLMFNCRGYPDDLYKLDLAVNLIGGPGRPTVKWRDFFQCGMETTSLVNVALTEMMLQSNEGAIRVFPAVPEAWKNAPLAFKLLARGGFLVAAERHAGAVTRVSIKSLNGGECRIRNPFTTGTTVVRDAAGAAVTTTPGPNGAIIFATSPGAEYTLLPADAKPDAAPTVFKSDPNKGPKVLEGGPKRRMLGLDAGMR